MIVEERPLSDRQAVLEVLRLQVAVDRRDDRYETGHRAAGQEHPENPGDHRHDPLHLLADHEVTQAAGYDEIEDQDQNGVFRRLLWIDDVAARGGRRARRGRWCRWRWCVRTARRVHRDLL